MAAALPPSTGLALPAYVPELLGRREELVVDQGFTDKELRLEWWNAELASAGLSHHRVTVDPNGTGAQRLTRGQLFRLAEKIDEDASDDAYLNLLWHVLAWGSGTSRRMNRARIGSFAAREVADPNTLLLRAAATHARSGAVADAYAGLIRRGGGEIGGLGPAFFTKFLYFAGAGMPEHQCLIFDARVAASLYHAGWTSLPRSRRRASWAYGANWYTQTYVEYCRQLRHWADAESAKLGRTVAADEIEVALFRRAGRN